MTNACAVIAEQMGELFTCLPHDSYTRIKTPYLYPDGDVIDVFVRDDAGRIIVTDLGESLRWFRMQTTSPRRSPKQRQLIDDICQSSGVELYRGMLVARASEPHLADAVTKVSQAALRVADLWFTVRNRTVQSISDDVAEFLSEREIRHERSEKLPGRSGRIWTLDFHTWTRDRTSLVYVLSTGSKASARTIVEHVVSSWFDLSHLKLGTQPLTFVSLFDDTMDVWSDQDLNLASGLSEIARWSQPEGFERILTAA